MNIQAMMKQAQALQKDMLKAKKEIDEKEFVGESSLVKITLLGTKEVKSVKIDSSSELDKEEQKSVTKFLKKFKPMYELDSKKYSEYYFGLLNGKKLSDQKQTGMNWHVNLKTTKIR